jgi:hypothetical protein
MGSEMSGQLERRRLLSRRARGRLMEAGWVETLLVVGVGFGERFVVGIDLCEGAVHDALCDLTGEVFEFLDEGCRLWTIAEAAEDPEHGLYVHLLCVSRRQAADFGPSVPLCPAEHV